MSGQSLLLRADALLRGRLSWADGEKGGRSLGWLISLVVGFAMSYGAVMGMYGIGPGRGLQVVYAAAKVPLLLLATGGLSLPCFFVLYTLVGLRHEFGAALRALLAAQAGLTMVLASLAPFTALWYISVPDYELAILFNGGMFAIASISAQGLLRRFYRPLIIRHPRHRLLLRAWLLIYVLVGIQMGWLLRPFIGSPEAPIQFFRPQSWGNAYEVVARLLWQVMTGS